MTQKKNQEYWEKNIKAFSMFYNNLSEENFEKGKLTTRLYKKYLLPIEKKYMKVRHEMVCSFIARNSSSEKDCADIGCGNGIYTVLLAEKNRNVFSYDYTLAAVNLTIDNLKNGNLTNATIEQNDITKDPIKKNHFSISIGVLPYIADSQAYFKNILPYTDKLLFNFLDAEHPLNRLRQVLEFLDMRDYSYHTNSQLEADIKHYGFEIISKSKLATGWMWEIAKK